jgi:hypothetical protein
MMRIALAAALGSAVLASACGPSPCNKGNVETVDKWCVIPITCPEGSEPSLHHERCELPDGGIVSSISSTGAGASADQSTMMNGLVRAAGSGGSRFPIAGAWGSSSGGSMASAAGHAGDGMHPSTDDADAGMSSGPAMTSLADAGVNGPRCGNSMVESGETCDGNCPSTCPPPMGCLHSELKGSVAACTTECVAQEITSLKPGDACCPIGATHATDADCPGSCGDGVVDGTETCDPVSTDKPCPGSCDDGDPCTKDKSTGSAAQCTFQCSHTRITAANSGDECCPAGANANTDSDCKPTCGNQITEANEKCDGDCPTSCVDGDPCTRDELTGMPTECTATCGHTSTMRTSVSCDDSDPCTEDTSAPSATSCTYDCKHSTPKSRSGGSCDDGDPCTDDMPTPSATSCTYDCKHSTPKSRSGGSCDDGNPCTDDMPVPSATSCTYDCRQANKQAGTDCGAGKMCNASGTCSEPPARCGDSKVQGTEECDSGGENWECDSSCRRTRLYTGCAGSSDCRNGQACVIGACTEVCTQQASGAFTCPSQDIPENALGVICYLEPAGDYGYCRPRCRTASDCPSGFHCADSVCLP